MRKMKDCDFQWIGQIPEDWMMTKVKFVADFYNGDRGKNYPSGDDLVDDGIVFLTSNNIHSTVLDTNPEITKYITPERYKLLGGAKIKKGDLVFCLRGSVGLCSINESEDEGTVASSLTVLRPKNINNHFLNFILNSKIAEIQTKKFENGSCAANLSAENVGTYIIPFPPLAEQQKIADFLDEKCGEIDSIRSDVQREIEILNDYKKSVITEAVTKGLDPKAKLKGSGIEWIGKIPEGWNVKKLKFYFNFGKGLPITKENLQDTGVPVISYGQIHSKQNSGTAINDTLIRFVNESYLRTNPSSLVHQNDFIFADTSEDLDGCGNCVYVDTKEPLFAGYHAIIFRSLQPNAKYFAYLFLTDCWRSQIRKVASGVKLYSITQKILKETSVIIPPLSEQKAIADYLDEKCSAIDATIADKQKQLETLDEYKKSLIFEYVTGKKEVS